MRQLPGPLSSRQQARRFAPWLALPVIAAFALAAFAWWWKQPEVPALLGKPQWVDEQQCQACHADAVKAWQGSHHQLAMQPANAGTVLGDFREQPLDSNGVSTRFRREGDSFWLNSEGANGQRADFKVAYTFGLEPLQQYLLELPGGRLQAHDTAWDVEKQQWFHLYPEQQVDSRHPLHWSGSQQNANAMCIECHTSGFQRGFDADRPRFDSRWQALGVGCQSCHGPASNHLQWARGERQAPSNHGFALDLRNAGNQAEVETCARCHSRRSVLGGDPSPGGQLYDDYQPAGLSAQLYEVDGKIKDEVFEYGSFVQSRMHSAGVRCSDCHEPHSAKLRLSGNAVCTQCHNPQARPRRAGIQAGGLIGKDYESPDHHRHAAGSIGAQCSSCHMPGKWYMQVDYRHDHSFSVPDPAQAQALGHSDACLSCHTEDKPQAIIQAFADWYGHPSVPHDGGYAQALSGARAARPGAAAALLTQLGRRDLPGLRKAALLAELPRYPSAAALNAALQGLQHPDPAVRLAAIETLPALMAPQQVAQQLPALLTDARRAVRLAATWQLLQLPQTLRPSGTAWQAALVAYESSQRTQLDRAEALSNLASLYQLSGRDAEVESLLRQALQRDPHFHPARVMLAQHLERSGLGQAARELLLAATQEYPQEASLQHAFGLQLVRQGERAEALRRLEQAAQLEPDNGEYAYVLAVAWHDSGRAAQAIDLLRRQLQAQPGDRRGRLALAGYLGAQGNHEEVQALREELRDINPEDPLLR
ncbi:hypothetical protein D3879_21385 [Pseudomonas cavernicola]|uniref:Uncharacterized protein n=1 Tax=Pseudomonas cavernicola TaxID=2320866 RepID=A0A418XDS3_9PSED|nr:tetratricopeptide repeat protein [Pseudomonas cavernicola]RJG10550.1 hypothetical protein D3879_21385 [Pseudomonas cavernicola]